MFLISIFLTVLITYSSEIPTGTENSNQVPPLKYSKETFRNVIPPRLKERCEELSVTEKFPIKHCEDYDMVVEVLKKARSAQGDNENSDEKTKGPLPPPIRHLEDLSKEQTFFESQMKFEAKIDPSKYKEEFFDKVNQGKDNDYGLKGPPKRRLNNDDLHSFPNTPEEERKKYEQMTESFKAKYKINKNG
ncbi:hypothetical protein SteCoe_25900 [Stentor coeruleus]|uniref:Uncharacterized protein n=1 Tax=Stentor coeruleus TaxID=5963 RepID=A0A1R2BEJ1_9CILI|nr:hypothetical protein SteCoe_25900 [Stentor coeruleus]